VKSRSHIVAALLLALAASSARGQEAAPTLQEDPRAAKFKDVERGFFVGFDLGYLSFLKTPTADPAAHPYAGTGGGRSNGVGIGLNVGVDIGKRVAISLFAQGANESASVDYGAFSVYAGGLDVRVALWSLADRNGWERFFAYAHARGAYARSWPTGLFGDVDALLSVGAGVEYFTRLRHFSVGAAVDWVTSKEHFSYYASESLLSRLVKSGGFAVYPTVRYTF